MLRRQSLALVASSSRPPLRPLATSASLLRQDQRLPQGRVKPRRIPSQPQHAIQPSPSSPFIPDHSSLDPSHTGGALQRSRPVVVPPDPEGVLSENHAAWSVLAHESLVVVRQLEMMNIFMGFEQANRYALYTPDGDLVGYMAEAEQSFVSVLTRQALRTHRPFRAIIMDRTGTPILSVRRPFAFINSRIFVRASEEEDGELVGEAQQEWHPWRRRYNIFQRRQSEAFQQFARVDSGLLAWDFWLKDRHDRLVASINRNFAGFGRELFTDTGQYVIRFDAAGTELDVAPGAQAEVQGQTVVIPQAAEGGLTLDQRAMALATAVSIDFDYFSRHSGSGGMGFPFFWMFGGDGSSDARAGGGAAAEAPGTAAGAAGAAGVEASRPDLPTGPDSEAASDFEREGMEGYEDDSVWGQDEEEVLEDPWAQSGEGDADGGSWFGGGDWGGWGE